MSEKNWTVGTAEPDGVNPVVWEVLGHADPDGVFSDMWLPFDAACTLAGVLRHLTGCKWVALNEKDLGL